MSYQEKLNELSALRKEILIAARKFEESDVKRDKSGRFATKGGSGTSEPGTEETQKKEKPKNIVDKGVGYLKDHKKEAAAIAGVAAGVAGVAGLAIAKKGRKSSNSGKSQFTVGVGERKIKLELEIKRTGPKKIKIKVPKEAVDFHKELKNGKEDPIDMIMATMLTSGVRGELSPEGKAYLEKLAEEAIHSEKEIEKLVKEGKISKQDERMETIKHFRAKLK